MSQAEVPLERIHVFYGKWVRSVSYEGHQIRFYNKAVK